LIFKTSLGCHAGWPLCDIREKKPDSFYTARNLILRFFVFLNYIHIPYKAQSEHFLCMFIDSVGFAKSRIIFKLPMSEREKMDEAVAILLNSIRFSNFDYNWFGEVFLAK
jgi:hypothetical protein